MLTVTLFFVIALILYIISVLLIFKFLYSKKKVLLVKLSKSLALVIGVSIILFTYLSQFDLTRNLSSILMTGGSIIIAIGTFSAQKILGNVLSGIVISSTKPFEIGEKIALMSSSGATAIEGVVIDINLRHTTIKQTDGRCSLVPNNVLDEMIVVNNNTLENNGHPLFMICSFDSDVDKAIELMQKVIDEHPLTILTEEQRNKVTCSDILEDGFKLQSIIWTRTLSENFKTCADLRISIFKIWEENGISIPFKTITIDR